MTDDYLTPAQVAQRLVISPSTVYAKIRSGEWEATKISDRIYRFSPEQFADITSTTAQPIRRTSKARLRAALAKIA